MTDGLSGTVLYLDTSALVKRYVVERGSLWLGQLCSKESEKPLRLRGSPTLKQPQRSRARSETEHCFPPTICESSKISRTTLRAIT